MVTRDFCIGTYVRIDAGHRKSYLAMLSQPSGKFLRYSRINMKTATLAKAWGERWAERVNRRSAGKVAILVPTWDRKGRTNIEFGDLGIEDGR